MKIYKGVPNKIFSHFFTRLKNIVSGAPMWTDHSSMGKFETGRVYVVYQSKEVMVVFIYT